MIDGAFPADVDDAESVALFDDQDAQDAPPDADVQAPDVDYGGRYLTRAQIERMSDEMTMGDSFRARTESPDDRQRMGVLAFYYAARRLGEIEQDVDLDAFLDRIRQDDFVAIVGTDRSGK